MSIDTVGDFLTIIRNGVRASKMSIVSPYSNFKKEITQILKDEGFIKEFEIIEEQEKKYLKINLKYVDGESVIHEITRISKPGRRNYNGSANIKPVIGGLGVSILTTNRGVVTNKTAKRYNVGGEVICTIW